MSNRTKVFISYSHKDKVWLDQLRVHLKPLERFHDIDVWDDQKIEPGSKWRDEIEDAISSARVAVLLVSASFLASDFIARDELPPLLEAAEKKGATILPVIISACGFESHEQLSQFKAVNALSSPLKNLTSAKREMVLQQVVAAIEASLKLPAGAHNLVKNEPQKEKPKKTAHVISEDRHPASATIANAESTPLYQKYGCALIIVLLILFALALRILPIYGKLSAWILPIVLMLVGVTAILNWLPFGRGVKWLTIIQPNRLRYRVLVCILGVFILASGVYVYKSTVSEPTLRSYFAYITLTPIEKPAGSVNPAASPDPKEPNCHVTYHVSIRFETSVGEQAVYVDRVKSGGGGTYLESTPIHDVLYPIQWPANSTLLDFKIEEKQRPSRFLDIEAVALLDTRVTYELAKIGPHLPYYTDYVVVVVDYSRMKFPSAPNDIWAQIEFPGPGGINQTKAIDPVAHPKAADGTITVVGRDLPANSNILIRWGQPKQ